VLNFDGTVYQERPIEITPLRPFAASKRSKYDEDVSAGINPAAESSFPRLARSSSAAFSAANIVGQATPHRSDSFDTMEDAEAAFPSSSMFNIT